MDIRLAEQCKSINTVNDFSDYCKSKRNESARDDVIGLGAGEPDFNTPQHIIDAAPIDE